MDRDQVTKYPPQLQTSEERTLWVNSAFDRAIQGKTIDFAPGRPVVCAPGSYRILDFTGLITYTDPGGQVWFIQGGGPFSLVTPATLVSLAGPGLTAVRAEYYPHLSDRGVPLWRSFAVDPVSGWIRLAIYFGGTWNATQITAGNAFVRSFNGGGPQFADYLPSAAGDYLNVSANAYL